MNIFYFLSKWKQRPWWTIFFWKNQGNVGACSSWDSQSSVTNYPNMTLKNRFSFSPLILFKPIYWLKIIMFLLCFFNIIFYVEAENLSCLSLFSVFVFVDSWLCTQLLAGLFWSGIKSIKSMVSCSILCSSWQDMCM